MTSSEFDKRLEDRTSLRNLIAQWNANRLDLFELSEPNEVSESVVQNAITSIHVPHSPKQYYTNMTHII